MITKSEQLNNARVSLVDPGLCPRYSTILLSDLNIQPSPAWLSVRLQNLGIRPVNNLVDLTNYVMLELGQPLHAFDLAKLKSRKITVRLAKEGEKLTTIDGEKRDLTPETLVIADDSKPIAIAGVMGGAESEISKTTSGALIESANFDPVSIRKTAERYKLRSEASLRFERGIDPNLTAVALARLVELLPNAGLIEAKTSRVVDEYPAPLIRQPIRYQPNIVKKITGVDVPTAEQIRILQGLGLTINESVEGNKEDLLVTPPSFRSDLSIPEDLVEEIIRLYGYDRVPRTLPKTKMIPRPYEMQRHWAKKIKNILRGAGYTEIETYSFANKSELEALRYDPRQHLELANPPTPEQAFMRSTLLPNALSTVKKNIMNGLGSMRFFELGRTYRVVRGEEYPFEGLRLLAVEVPEESRQSKKGEALEGWKHLNQVLDAIMFHFGLDTKTLRKEPFVTNKALHHGRAAALTIEEEDIGYLAEIHPLALTRLDIERRVTVLDLDFEKLIKMARGHRQYQEMSKFPPVVRDISIVMNESEPAQNVIDLINQAGAPLLTNVVLFDRFSGESIGKAKKSYAFHLTFQTQKRTLKESEVEQAMKKIEATLIRKKIVIRT